MLGIIFEILYLVSAIIPLVFFVYLKKQKNKTEASRALAELELVTFVWLLIEFLASLGFVPSEWQLITARLMHFFAILVTWLVLRFIFIFLNIYKKHKKWYLVSTFLLWSFFFVIIMLSGLVVSELKAGGFFWEMYYNIGPFFPLFAFFTGLPILLSTVFVFYYFFKAGSKKIKRQLAYVGTGLFFPLIIGILTNLVFPLLKVDFPRLANFSALILIIFLFLAIYYADAFGVRIEKISFKLKIFLIYFFTILVSIFVFYLFVIYIARTTYEEKAGDAVLLSLQNISANFDFAIDNRIKELRLISQDDLIKKRLKVGNSSGTSTKEKEAGSSESKTSQKTKKILPGEAVSKYLDNFNYELKNDLYLDIYITNNNGVNLNSSPYTRSIDAEKSALKKVKKENVYVSDSSRSREGGSYFLISKSIFNENEEFLGMVTAAINLEELYKQLNVDLNYSYEEEENALRIINHEGKIIYSPQKKEEQRSLEPEIRNLLLKRIKANDSGYKYKRDKYYHVKELYIFVNIFKNSDYAQEKNWTFLLRYDTEEFLGPIKQIKETIILIAVLLLFFSILVFYYISKIFSRPLEKLEEGVKKIEEGNLDYRLEVRTRDEIGSLSESFNQMVKSIKESRKEVDEKVENQTREITKQRDEMDKQKKAILNILEDVEEEKKKAEQERNRIKTMLYSIGDGVLVIDNNREVTLFNQAAENVSGYSFKEVEGKKYDEVLKFLNKEGKKDDFIEKTFETRKITNMGSDTVLINKKGEKIPVSDSASPLKDQEGNLSGVVVVFKDVTQERAIDKAKTEFVSLASHQLRTPLSTINWYAEMLLDEDVGKLNKEQEEFLEQIYTGNKRMVDLVNSLLNVSRIEMGTLEVKPEPLNFGYVAESVLNELKPSIKEKKLKIEKKIPKKLPEIKADKNLIRIIFQNLLSNAVKYTPEKGKISFSLTKQKEYLLIKVSDSGMGIPKKSQEKIFTKLFRADNVKEKDTEGTGLGLYVVKSILDQAGGKIWFESAKNKGTTFYVKFPLKGMKKKKGRKTLNPTK